MLLNSIKPAAYLAPYIRLFRIVDFHFADASVIPAKLYAPKPEQCLQFFPKDPETASYPGAGPVVAGKRATCVGQHTVLLRRQVGREFLSVQVVFQPGVLYRLTGIALHELENQYVDAADLFGSGVHEVSERLFFAPDYPGMIAIVEQFLAGLLRRIRKPEHCVDLSARQMLLLEDQFSLDGFLRAAWLSPRQFDRKFHEHLGVAPKLFLRVVRFDRAFRMKNRHPELDWLSVAVRCGYHDYQHLVRDYKEFTGHTPPQFFALDRQAPERHFGDAEV